MGRWSVSSLGAGWTRCRRPLWSRFWCPRVVPRERFGSREDSNPRGDGIGFDADDVVPKLGLNIDLQEAVCEPEGILGVNWALAAEQHPRLVALQSSQEVVRVDALARTEEQIGASDPDLSRVRTVDSDVERAHRKDGEVFDDRGGVDHRPLALKPLHLEGSGRWRRRARRHPEHG